VRSADVRREFPDRLAVQLEEHQAAGALEQQRAGEQAGRGVQCLYRAALPGFIGQRDDSGEVAQRYAQFSRQLATLNLQVAQLALSPRHAWQLRLEQRMVLELGREECSSVWHGSWRYTVQPGGARGFGAICGYALPQRVCSGRDG